MVNSPESSTLGRLKTWSAAPTSAGFWFWVLPPPPPLSPLPHALSASAAVASRAMAETSFDLLTSMNLLVLGRVVGLTMAAHQRVGAPRLPPAGTPWVHGRKA